MMLYYSRVRFLPPIEERAFAGLRGSVVAVLDPFPVGLHLPLLEALLDGVPVVSTVYVDIWLAARAVIHYLPGYNNI